MSDRKRKVDRLFDEAVTLQAGEIARKMGVTRQTAHRHLRQLVSEGRLISENAGRSTRYRRANPIDQRHYLTDGLEEDRVWTEMSGEGSIVSPLTQRARAVLQYALTELVNNAIDHSDSLEVFVCISQQGKIVSLEVRDEGVGIFNQINEKLGLGSPLEALQELSKGKTTT